ncbi:zinc-binding dehydrogenase [Patescibacteria group bacterium]|nr:zinc-binding dehydrogenase [Patescibacteria group bacterium]
MINIKMYKGIIIKLNGPKKIKFEKTVVDDKNLEPSEIIAKTIFTAISPGTETAAYIGATPLRPGPIYPRLLGYCNVGKIIKKGSLIKDIKIGDTVLTLESHRSIYKIPAKDIVSIIPKNLDPKKAALAYLYNLGVVSLENFKINKKSGIAIIGLGAIGLATIEMAKALGYKNIYAFSNSKEKLTLAKKIGANFIYSKNTEIEKIVSLIITTSNSWNDWKLALKITKKNGYMAILSFPGRGNALPKFNPLESKYFYDKNLTIASVGHSRNKNPEQTIRNNCKKILKLMSAKKILPEKLISGIYDYHKIEKAYKKILNRDQKTTTFILKWPK